MLVSYDINVNPSVNRIISAAHRSFLAKRKGNLVAGITLEVIQNNTANEIVLRMQAPCIRFGETATVSTEDKLSHIDMLSVVDEVFYIESFMHNMYMEFEKKFISVYRSNNIMQYAPLYTVYDKLDYKESMIPLKRQNEIMIREDMAVPVQEEILAEGDYEHKRQLVVDKIGGKYMNLVFKPTPDITTYELHLCQEVMRYGALKGSKMAFITDHNLNRHWEVVEK